MANTIEKIFKLLLEFGDSEARIEKMGKLLQSLNARLRDVLKNINDIGKTDGLKKASEVLGVYKFSVDNATKSKKKLVEAGKEENAQTEAAQKYIEQLKAKYGNLTFTKKEIATLTKNYTVLQRAEKGSVEETTAKINILNTAWKKMGTEALKKAPGKQITTELKQMRDSLRQTTMGAGDFSRNIGRYAGSIQSAFAKIGAAWMAVKGIFNLFRNSIKTITDFEQANTNLATVLGKSIGDIKALTDSALELGRTTEYTASQVTKLQMELAKLGFGESAIQSMQKPILQFATAVGADLPAAAALAGATLRAFDLDAKDTDEMLSVLAVVTNKSALSFSYLQTAMSIVSPVARMFGFDVKDTAALLGTLANSGFDASMAATATRNILLNLADANGKLAKALGQPVHTLPELIGGLKTLRERGVDLATTLELTDKRSVAAFNTFLNGADNLKLLRGELENTNGELKRIQEERLNTVEGSVKLLTSAWEGLVLSFSNSKGAFKTVVDGLTSVVEAMSDLINPQNRVDRRINAIVEQIIEEYNAGGLQGVNSYFSAGETVEKRHVEATQQNWVQRILGIGYGNSKEAYDSYNEFLQAAGIAQEKIAAMRAEEADRAEKDVADAKAKAAAEKDAKIKASQEAAKAAKTAREKKEKEDEKYAANRSAQADAITQYDFQHQETEINKLAEGVDKKIKLNELATRKAQYAAKKEYDNKIDQLNKQQKEYEKDPEKVAKIEAEKDALAEKYRQKKRDIDTAGANARTKILQDATAQELEEYKKVPGKAAEAERQITENKRREVEERLKLARLETEQSIGIANNQYGADEDLADVTLGRKGRKRNVAHLQNEVQLHNNTAQAYQKELNEILARGDDAIEKHKARYNELILLIGQEQQAVMNLGKGKNADGTRKSFWQQLTELSDEDLQQIKQQAIDLGQQLSDAIFDAKQQASQRQLNAEKKAIDAEYKTEAKLLDSKRDKGLISEKQYQKELEKLEAKKTEKEEEAERAAFEREKKLNIQQVLMNTALGIAKAIAQSPLTWGLPWAAFVAAQGVIQVAAIKSQKYAQGGMIPLGDGMGVVKGRSHAQGGHRIYLDGTPIGEVEGDELLAIVNKRDTARIGALSAANSVHGRRFASGGLVNSGGFLVNYVSAPVSIGQLEAKQRTELTNQQKESQNAVIALIREDTKQQIEAMSDRINDRIDTLKVIVVAQDVTDAQNDIKRIKAKQSF